MQSLLNRAETELQTRIQNEASRQVSAGFTKADIEQVCGYSGTIFITYSGHTQRFPWSQLNRRELEELIEYLKERG